jgi:uncharacterized protein
VIPAATADTGAPSQDGAPVFHAPLRVVLDTNVLLSLFVFADSRFAPLRQKVETGAWSAWTSEACFAEFRRVIARPLFRLDAAAQETVCTAWARLAHHAPPAADDGPALPRCKDRDDQKFLELARDAGADWLVTADKALLRLARRDRLRGLFRILTPEAALEEG